MKIGLIVLSIGAFGEKGFYNLQEVGLAKALDKYCEEVKIFKLVCNNQKSAKERISGTRHSEIFYIPSKVLGTNGIPNCRKFHSSLDAYICFSDTQFMFPNVYHWAKKNNIKIFPYLGVTKSHSTNPFKSIIINTLFSRNVKRYRKCTCFAKTPAVQKFLQSNKVAKVTLTPVGLDLSLTKSDYSTVSPVGLKQKYGYNSSDKVLLFIGRLTAEKEPLRLVDIFNKLLKKDKSYRLLVVGSGELKSTITAKIKEYQLADKIQMIDRIANYDIWELYCLADTFINLNRQEIFGMAILEAMYYGCKVVAQKAPGPDLIIENGISGYLTQNDEEMVQMIHNGRIEKQKASRRVIDHFTWEVSAKAMMEAMS